MAAALAEAHSTTNRARAQEKIDESIVALSPVLMQARLVPPNPEWFHDWSRRWHRRPARTMRGIYIRYESVPVTRLIILGTGPETPVLSWLEDTAMLVFYLPIIIFEAMLEPHANKRKTGEPTDD